MGKVFVRTLGCKVNHVESRDIAHELLEQGIGLTDVCADATVVVINTCSVTARSDAKVRKEIRKALGYPSVSCVVATGCSAVIHAETLTGLDSRVKVVSDKTKVTKEVSGLLSSGGEQTPGASVSHTMRDENPAGEPALSCNLERTRVNVKISDGCENFCSYCIVPFARGMLRPVPARDIVDRVRDLVQKGVHEIVLTGINVGTYQEGSLTLAGLIRLLKEETGIHRIRVSSIEPDTITDDFIALLQRGDVLCEHLHIPLQSGSNAVLAHMKRRYTADEYCSIISNLRSVVPDIAIHADVIVGYPTETDEDFSRTLTLIDELALAGVHAFKYSSRPGTEAASLCPLAPRVIEERCARLAEVAHKNAASYRTARLSSAKPLELIIEQRADDEVIATSREHITISWSLEQYPFPNAHVGDIVEYVEGSSHECLDRVAS